LVLGLRALRLQSRCFSVLCHSLIRLACLLQHPAQFTVRPDVTGVRLQRLPVGRRCLLKPLLSRQDLSQLLARVCLLRIKAYDFLKVPSSLAYRPPFASVRPKL